MQASPDQLQAARLCGTAFDAILTCLRNEDNPLNIVPKMPIIRDAINLLWDMVHNKFVAVGTSNGFKSITFFSVQKKNENARAFVILPPQYATMVTHDTPTQMGAIVSVASQVKDYWNNKLIEGKQKTDERSLSMEAYFIKTLLEEFPHLENEGYPSTYQKDLLEKYPEGIESVLTSHYKSRPFDVSAGPPWPMPIEDMAHKFKEADSLEELMKVCSE